MTYRIEVAPAAARQLRKLDPSAQRRIHAAIELLAEQPRPSGATIPCPHAGLRPRRAASPSRPTLRALLRAWVEIAPH